MKKIGCLIFVLSAAAYTASAQFYLRAGLGYAFPQAGQTTYNTGIPYYEFSSAYSGTRTINASGSQTYNIKPVSFSSGVQSVLGLGYMFTENIGFQLDAGIGLADKKYTFNDENIPINYASGSTVVTIVSNVSTTQQASTPFFLMPSLVLQTNRDKLNVYTHFGLALPLNTKITEHQIITNAPGTGSLSTDDFTWQVKSGFSLGFTAALGLKYSINDKVSIWGELSLLSMAVYTKEQDLQSWVEDGQPVALSNYPNAQKIKFSKTATVDSTYSSFPTYAQPFSNIGINVGVSFNLSEKRTPRHSKHNSDIEVDDTKPFRRR